MGPLLPCGESKDLPKQHNVEEREDSKNKENNALLNNVV